MNQSPTIKNTKPVNQGVVVVERDGRGFIVMFPSGDVQSMSSSREVERVARRWFAANISDSSIGVGRIEWRGCGPAVKS